MKTNQTILPLTITTALTHKNKFEEAAQCIERTSHYLAAILWAMRVAAEGYELLNMQNDTELFSFGDYRGNVQSLAEIAEAFSQQLTVYTLAFDDCREEKPAKPAEPDEVVKSDAETLAEKISYLMRSDDVPSPISGGLTSVMLEFFNTHIDQDELEDETSPAYIARLLKCSTYFTGRGTRTEGGNE